MENMIQTDREHDFALILGGIEDLNDDVADALFDAGCDDGTLALQRGAVTMDFSRRAPTLRDAILSAITDVHRNTLGVYVVRVDDCSLVTQADVARRANLERATISNYASGKRGPGDFPVPVCHITEGQPLYQWCEVAYWLRRNGQIGMETLDDARDIYVINALLDCDQARRAEPAEFAAIRDELAAHSTAR